MSDFDAEALARYGHTRVAAAGELYEGDFLGIISDGTGKFGSGCKASGDDPHAGDPIIGNYMPFPLTRFRAGSGTFPIWLVNASSVVGRLVT